MHNLIKTRIKKRRQGLTRGGGSHEESSTASVGTDFEFVNFNPFVYRQKNSLDNSSAGNVSLVKSKPSHCEDFYEFPTSTKLTSPSKVDPSVEVRNRAKDSSKSHLQRHSINSTYDLLANKSCGDEFTPGKYSPTPTATFVTTISPSCTFYLPIPPDRRSQRSSIVVNDDQNGGNPPPLPPPARRPRSWGSDSGTGNLVAHRRSIDSDNWSNSNSSQSPSTRSKIKKEGKSPMRVTSSLLHAVVVVPPIVYQKPDYPRDGQMQSIGNISNNSRSDKRPDTLSEERLTNDGKNYEDVDPIYQDTRRPSSNAVGRSESCKEGQPRKQKRERRKHSDPSLTSKSTDADIESQRTISDVNSSSSSNSSLSASSRSTTAGIGGDRESPSSSLELVASSGHSASFLHHHGRNANNAESSDTASIGPSSGGVLDSNKTIWDGDSDIENEQDQPDWTKYVPELVLHTMTQREKKRQEVLNELLHTERSHVRNIKILDRLFHRPLKQNKFLPSGLVQMLFGNLEEMLEIHCSFNTLLKKKKIESPIISNIGSVLLQIFDGDTSKRFKKTASAYCSRQQIGLKMLKEKREKNIKLNTFLSEIEQDPICRRLQIQDMIPMAMQRLTKYPLLFETLYNCTDDEAEKENIQKALEMSKEILYSVNCSKKEAEDYDRLADIQKRLDKSLIEKNIDKEKPSDMSAVNELRSLDLTKHKLIREGTLMWRIKSNKQKSEILQEVLLLLLDDMVVILLKQDERFVLKIHSSSSYPSSSKSDRILSRPIIKLNNMIHRANASNKTAFMLINVTSTNMYELVCSTTEERKQWLHHITKTSEDYKFKQQESKRDLNTSANIPQSFHPEDDRDDGTHKEPNDTGENIDRNCNDTTTSEKDSASSATPSQDNLPLKDDGAGGSAGAENQQSADGKNQASPNRTTKPGNVLIITEHTNPLIEPTEVMITTRDILFAQPVTSNYEELKKVDNLINRAFDDKMNLIKTTILHKTSLDAVAPGASSSSESSSSSQDDTTPKDIIQIVVDCIEKVDQLGRIITNQKITNENIDNYKEQISIQQNLNQNLIHLLSEIQRKDNELETRRHELCRIRELNHGYQERLQQKQKQPQQSNPETTTATSSEQRQQIEQMNLNTSPVNQQNPSPIHSW